MPRPYNFQHLIRALYDLHGVLSALCILGASFDGVIQHLIG